MSITDSNAADQFDRTEVVLGDKDDPSKKIVIQNDRLLVDAKFTKDNGQIDTRGRLRTVLPVELFSYYFSHTKHDLKFNTTTFNGGTGTTSLALNKGFLDIQNSLSNTHKINFSSKKYIRYSPGQTHKITIAGRAGTSQSGVEKRWGLFTEFNGFYFKQDSTGLSVVVRRGGAGDPVTETVVPQSSWNRNKVDGTGNVPITLNTENHGIYLIEWDWHGAGVIKFGIVYGHEVIYCHEFEYDFQQADPSIRSPSLPINIELRNTTTQTVAPVFSIAAVSAYKDGSEPLSPTYSFSASRGASSLIINNSADVPLLSIRPKLSFNGLLARIALVPTELQVLSATNNMYVRVVLNGTLTGASFSSVGINSNAERDISATSVTGGTVIWEGYVSGGSNPGDLIGSIRNWELNVDYTNTIQETLTITARSLGNNNTTFASIRWQEFQ